MSAWIGFGSDEWVYFNMSDVYPVNQSLAHQYIYSFYWSTLTLTTIGETPRPVRDTEYLFMVVDFLIGVLIFATVVGNVGNMITNMNAARADFQQKMDGVRWFMKRRNVQPTIQKKVMKWFDYMWFNRQSVGETEIFDKLPDNLKTEIAIHVHLETLRRVSLFKYCDPGLLVQLVLKLKPSVFSPGDYVCRKGDIGREMYIVRQGYLMVVADDGTTPLATLSEGSVFGEVSLLNIAGNKTGNRRTADVRSIGYSDLFSLSKGDLWQALLEYPEAKRSLIARGKDLLMKDNLLDQSVAQEADDAQSPEDLRVCKLTRNLDRLSRQFARLQSQYEYATRKLKKRLDTIESNLAIKTPSTSSNNWLTTPHRWCILFMRVNAFKITDNSTGCSLFMPYSDLWLFGIDWYIEAEAKWPPFRRRCFKMHFLECRPGDKPLSEPMMVSLLTHMRHSASMS